MSSIATRSRGTASSKRRLKNNAIPIRYEVWSRLGAGAEPQGPTGMLDRQIRLPGPQPEKAADVPAARVARIEGESAIDQRDHRIDVFAETGERKAASASTPGSFPATPTARRAKSMPFCGSHPRSGAEASVTNRMQQIAAKRESRAIVRVAGDGLLEQRQRLPRSALVEYREMRKARR